MQRVGLEPPFRWRYSARARALLAPHPLWTVYPQQSATSPCTYPKTHSRRNTNPRNQPSTKSLSSQKPHNNSSCSSQLDQTQTSLETNRWATPNSAHTRCSSFQVKPASSALLTLLLSITLRLRWNRTLLHGKPFLLLYIIPNEFSPPANRRTCNNHIVPLQNRSKI